MYSSILSRRSFCCDGPVLCLHWYNKHQPHVAALDLSRGYCNWGTDSGVFFFVLFYLISCNLNGNNRMRYLLSYWAMQDCVADLKAQFHFYSSDKCSITVISNNINVVAAWIFSFFVVYYLLETAKFWGEGETEKEEIQIQLHPPLLKLSLCRWGLGPELRS